MKRYNKKEYLKYVRELKQSFSEFGEVTPIDFKTWKEAQLIADKAG